MRTLTDEERKNVIDAGKFGFSKNKLAAILAMPKSEVNKALDDPESEISRIYKQGKEISLLEVCQALEKKALEGDSKAAERLIEVKNDIIERHAIDEYFGE